LLLRHHRAQADGGRARKSKNLLEKRVCERTRELREANEELEAEIARRKGLEGEILEISDRERRLGQELHDGLCQHLTAVAFMARSVVLRLKNHSVIEVGDVDKIAKLVNDAVTNTRDLTGHTGAALFWRSDFQSATNRVCTMFHDGKTQLGCALRPALKSDAIVGHAQDNSVLPVAHLDHYVPRQHTPIR
jgi:signal transduction histidine kinase